MKAVVLRTRWLLTALLLVGAVLLVIGVTAERGRKDGHTGEAAAEHVEQRSGETHDEAREVAAPAEDGEASTHADAGEAGSHSQNERETVLGVDVESPPLVAVAVALSLAFAILVWFRREPWLLWTVAGFAVVFTVFDAVELLHQIDEHRTTVAVAAALLALVHTGATLVAGTRATADTAGREEERWTSNPSTRP